MGHHNMIVSWINSCILCKILRFQTRVAQKSIQYIGFMCIGRVNHTMTFNIQNWFICSSIRNWFANEAIIVNKDSPILMVLDRIHGDNTPAGLRKNEESLKRNVILKTH